MTDWSLSLSLSLFVLVPLFCLMLVAHPLSFNLSLCVYGLLFVGYRSRFPVLPPPHRMSYNHSSSTEDLDFLSFHFFFLACPSSYFLLVLLEPNMSVYFSCKLAKRKFFLECKSLCWTFFFVVAYSSKWCQASGECKGAVTDRR
jgi:hypothetical protein